MNHHIIFTLHLCIIPVISGRNSIIDEYVKNITQYQNQVLNWTYQENSYSYIGPNYDANKYINDGEYDFIICGAGSTGSVLANRLSEKSEWRILLLEAGTWENYITDIPYMADNLRTTDYNWGYYATPQKNILKGYIDNGIFTPRGRALGGSSVINSMIYARGHKADFDKWGKSNPGWSYDDVLPYFKKSENVSFPNADKNYHGTNGTLGVEYSRIFDQVGQAFLNANKELGRKLVDYNAAEQLGFSIVQLNEVNGRRDSGSKAFINPAKKRSNLHIQPNSLITKLLIERRNKEVFGVQYIRNGILHYAFARREVILSAGSINTPQILMLSGVGPRQHLEKHGIPVVQDLPVGDNLWDHLVYGFQSFGINYTYVNQDLRTQVEEYLNGTGPLTTADDLQAIGYVKLYDNPLDVPDVEHVFHTSNPSAQPYQVAKNLQRLTEESYNTIINPTVGISQWAVHSILLHPTSRGTIRLKSSSPFDYPIIDPNYLAKPKDVETIVKAIKDIFKIAGTKSMQKYNSTNIKVCHPACKCSEYGTDTFWGCMASNLANSVFHFSGTAKMGPKNDITSVVDNQLKVHGIKRLRIADCSVIPVTTSGHTNAVAYMIGEKASDLIKHSHCNKMENY